MWNWKKLNSGKTKNCKFVEQNTKVWMQMVSKTNFKTCCHFSLLFVILKLIYSNSSVPQSWNRFKTAVVFYQDNFWFVENPDHNFNVIWTIQNFFPSLFCPQTFFVECKLFHRGPEWHCCNQIWQKFIKIFFLKFLVKFVQENLVYLLKEQNPE